MFSPKWPIVSLLASAFIAASGGLAAAQSDPPQTKSDPPVAAVNGTTIYLSDVEIAYAELPAQVRRMPIQQIFEPLLQQLIDRRLVAHAAETEALDQDEFVRRRLAQTREIVLRQAYVARLLEPVLTKEKVRARYEAEYAGKTGEEEVRARHILVAEESLAHDIAGKARAGIDFVELAKKNSTGPSAAQGGDLGFFKRGQMVPEFADVAFALAPGEVSQPVKTQFGWHVIKLEERRQTPAPTFEEVADKLSEQIARETVDEVVAGLRARAEIQTFGATGQPVITPPGIRPAK